MIKHLVMTPPQPRYSLVTCQPNIEGHSDFIFADERRDGIDSTANGIASIRRFLDEPVQRSHSHGIDIFFDMRAFADVATESHKDTFESLGGVVEAHASLVETRRIGRALLLVNTLPGPFSCGFILANIDFTCPEIQFVQAMVVCHQRILGRSAYEVHDYALATLMQYHVNGHA